MITADDLLCIGYIKRTHGFKGELNIELNERVAPQTGDFLFVKLDGQFIPFRITSIKGKTQAAVLKLEFVNDFDYARRISGHEIYLNTDKAEDEEPLALIGYELHDENLGIIGTITDLQEMPAQLMLIVEYKGKDCLIPLAEDLILELDHRKRILLMDLPSGILDQ